MKPWFIREDNVVPFPKKDKGVVRLPNVNAYPDFLTGVQDLQNHLKNGDISPDIHKKLYQDLIQRFMKVESFETPWFIRETIDWIGLRKAGAVQPMLYYPGGKHPVTGEIVPPSVKHPNIITKVNLDQHKKMPTKGERFVPLNTTQYSDEKWQKYMDDWWSTEKDKAEAKDKIDQIRQSARELNVSALAPTEDVERPWFLREAVGISGRKPGDVFQNLKNPKDQITFDLFKPYPDNKMRFENVEEMLKEIKNIQKKIPNLTQVNQPNKSQMAFGLAVFDSAKGKQGFIKFARDVQQVNNPGWWKNDAIPGYQPYFRTAKKVSSGFDPSSIFGKATNKSAPFTSQDVIKKINDRLGPEFSQPIAEIISKKVLPTFKDQKENETAIRDNFGEVFGPIALMSNAQGVTGPYKEAEKYLGQTFSSCKIFYPTQQTNPLTDSYLIASNGKEMGISSKGKKGANASINSLAKNIIQLKENDPKNPLLEKYKFTVDILTFLNEADYINGPVDLAEKIKLIDSSTAQEIKRLWQPRSEEKDIRKYPKLRKIYDLYTFDRGPNDVKFRLRFAILANIAKAVAEKVNGTKGFGEGALNFLNQSQIIQAYTQTTSNNNDVVVTEIRTIYPPNFQGILILNGGKNYYSTNAVGKIAFDFKPI